MRRSTTLAVLLCGRRWRWWQRGRPGWPWRRRPAATRGRPALLSRSPPRPGRRRWLLLPRPIRQPPGRWSVPPSRRSSVVTVPELQHRVAPDRTVGRPADTAVAPLPDSHCDRRHRASAPAAGRRTAGARSRHPHRRRPPMRRLAPPYTTVLGWHGVGQIAYLTFDDGPGPYTGRMLDILAAAGVKATFCQLGQRVTENPALTARVVAEGHTLCNHSWDHHSPFDALSRDRPRPANRAAPRTLSRQADRRHRPILPGTGGPVRRPGGPVMQAAQRARTVPLGWGVDSLDWRKPGAAAIVANVLGAVSPGRDHPDARRRRRRSRTDSRGTAGHHHRSAGGRLHPRRAADRPGRLTARSPRRAGTDQLRWPLTAAEQQLSASQVDHR